MPKRVYIIHGWGGSPEGNWFPWLKKELEKIDIKVEVLPMPHSDNPILSEWLDTLKNAIDKPDENVYLIGHSLGPITIVRYLETLGKGEKIGGAVFIAGFPESVGIEETKTFFETPVDYEKVKSSADKFVAINSDNDPYVPIKMGELLRDKLGAELIIMKNAGHINKASGYAELSIVFEKLKEIMGEN